MAVKGQRGAWRIEGRRRCNELAPARLTGILPLRTHPAVTLLEAGCRSRTGLAYVGGPSDQGARYGIVGVEDLAD